MGQVIKGLPLTAFWSNVCREEQRINADVLKDSHCNKQSVKAAGAAGECFVGFGFDSVTLPLLMSSTNTQLYRSNSRLHTLNNTGFIDFFKNACGFYRSEVLHSWFNRNLNSISPHYRGVLPNK